MDSSPKIKMGKLSSGSIASGFLVTVPTRSAANDSTAPIAITSRQKPTI
ncbi:Uncharacterised protein [Mycobacterium tuberculosis]|nr:Uncharacterised protein [Mycobacterium tuberculosis]COZ80669.1 Uncharacterised protein [Mycobacterium tuberculosis]